MGRLQSSKRCALQGEKKRKISMRQETNRTPPRPAMQRSPAQARSATHLSLSLSAVASAGTGGIPWLSELTACALHAPTARMMKASPLLLPGAATLPRSAGARRPSLFSSPSVPFTSNLSPASPSRASTSQLRCYPPAESRPRHPPHFDGAETRVGGRYRHRLDSWTR